jgi:Response regulator of the LytR/AlgR family
MQTSPISQLKPLVIKTCDGYEYFNYHEVIRFQADGNNTLVYIINRDEPLRISCSLSTVEQRYLNAQFYRCHRSHIINLQYLVKFNDKSRQLTLVEKQVVPISENYLKEFLSRTVQNS